MGPFAPDPRDPRDRRTTPNPDPGSPSVHGILSLTGRHGMTGEEAVKGRDLRQPTTARDIMYPENPPVDLFPLLSIPQDLPFLYLIPFLLFELQSHSLPLPLCLFLFFIHHRHIISTDTFAISLISEKPIITFSARLSLICSQLLHQFQDEDRPFHHRRSGDHCSTCICCR